MAEALAREDASSDRERAAGAQRRLALIVSCEHGGRAVPGEYQTLFADAAARRALDSHRAYDAGAAEVARALGERLDTAPFIGDTTRLLVDLNRSDGHPRLFSEFTRALRPSERTRIVERYYLPYRDAVEAAVRDAAARGSVLHVSAHTFTPVLDGHVRRADVGLLFDPGRGAEAAFALLWRNELRTALGQQAVVRRNYPYRGVSDGFTTHLRKRFGANVYLGLELEVNQRHVGGPGWPALVAALGDSLERAVHAHAVSRAS